MYELTVSEAATVLSVLSRAGAVENSDLGPMGIPPSTFYSTRRKIYEAGWVMDRYVPHPWAIRVLAIDFVLTSPGPAELAQREKEWASSPTNVVLWSGLNVMFGVFFRMHGDAPAVEDGISVSVRPESGSIPVYFDYSRPWSRFIRLEKETGYPRPLGESNSPTERTASAALIELVDRDRNGAAEPSRGHRWHSSSGLPRSHQRLLERGLVRSRTILNVDTLPPFDGRRLGEIVFLTGELREGLKSNDVLGTLNNECHVSPILLADDGVQLVIVALGQVGESTQSRTRVPRASGHVAATLDSALRNLKMTIERTDSIRKLVDHRYDRLFPALRASPEDKPAQRPPPL